MTLFLREKPPLLLPFACRIDPNAPDQNAQGQNAADGNQDPVQDAAP